MEVESAWVPNRARAASHRTGGAASPATGSAGVRRHSNSPSWFTMASGSPSLEGAREPPPRRVVASEDRRGDGGPAHPGVALDSTAGTGRRLHADGPRRVSDR